jgi:hypothetical protein
MSGGKPEVYTGPMDLQNLLDDLAAKAALDRFTAATGWSGL